VAFKPKIVIIVTVSVAVLALLCLVMYRYSKPALRPAIHLNTSGVSTKPVRLIIDKIGVNAPVIAVGRTQTGDMEAPTNATDTGWYKFGPRPGDIGTSVIDGHFGPWQGSNSSVFDNLKTLSKGDTIDILGENDTTIRFVVREIKTYDAKDSTTQVFESSDKKSHLNLITCDGEWSEATKSYSLRLVVFTDKM